MVSQPPAGFDSVEFNSFIWGYYAYKHIWEPCIGETLLLNVIDRSAVAVMKETVVGHIPCNISSALFMFLRRECNKGFVEVTGNCINRGAGYGMEVSCVYRLYGPTNYIRRLQQIIQSLQERAFVIQWRELCKLYIDCHALCMH